MLSYRHSFHAGNHADLLKHLCQMLILEKLTRKNKPCVYIDTHSGAGLYDLSASDAQKNREFETGVSLLENADAAVLQQYRDLLNGYFHKGQYPGSPEISRRLLREDDRMILMEFHPTEIDNLRANLRTDAYKNHDESKAGPQIGIHHRDGFEGLLASVPPKPARGLVLIDPPYERYEEYQQVQDTLKRAINKWSQGIYAVWYPLLSARAGKKSGQSEAMVDALLALPVNSLLNVTLQVADKADDTGMFGSGVAIINPPWQLDTELQDALPALCQLMREQAQASFSIDWLKEAD